MPEIATFTGHSLKGESHPRRATVTAAALNNSARV